MNTIQDFPQLKTSLQTLQNKTNPIYKENLIKTIRNAILQNMQHEWLFLWELQWSLHALQQDIQVSDISQAFAKTLEYAKENELTNISFNRFACRAQSYALVSGMDIYDDENTTYYDETRIYYDKHIADL